MNECAKVERQKQIPYEIERIGIKASQLMKLSEVLEGDLHSAVIPSGSLPKDTEELTELVPMASELRSIWLVLNNVHENLESLFNRIEL